MRESLQAALAVLAMSAILVALAAALGVTPEGLQYGKWPQTDDHPTNWADTALHP
jgi:hypothetical protein